MYIPEFPNNCLPVSFGDIGFKKNPRSCNKEIWPQSAFAAFRAMLPSANNSAEWSGRVWQPSEDRNGHLAHIYSNLKPTKQPLLSAEGCHARPSKFKFKKIGPNGHYYISAEGCQIRLDAVDGQHCPLRTYHGVFLGAEEPSKDINSRLYLMKRKGFNACLYLNSF